MSPKPSLADLAEAAAVAAVQAAASAAVAAAQAADAAVAAAAALEAARVEAPDMLHIVMRTSNLFPYGFPWGPQTALYMFDWSRCAL